MSKSTKKVDVPKDFDQGQAEGNNHHIDVHGHKPQDPRKASEEVQHDRQVIHPLSRINQLRPQERVPKRCTAMLAKLEETPIHVDIPCKCVGASDERDHDVGRLESVPAIVSEREVDKELDQGEGILSSVQQVRDPFEGITVTAETLQETEPGWYRSDKGRNPHVARRACRNYTYVK